MNGVIEWIVFGLLAGIAVVMAASMLLTMSMYRAGLALMASFVALAGIFILLDADLPAMMQIMMNVGGMLIMMLFMVMLMMDPGGEMMWDMKRSMHMGGLGAFSMTMPRRRSPAPHHHPAPATTSALADGIALDHPAIAPMPQAMMVMSDMPHGGTAMSPMPHDDMAMDDDKMMRDMAMSTAQLPWALVIGVATALALGVLVSITPWPLSQMTPSGDASAIVGTLLLGRYMVGFEGAAFLIVAGIGGAVILGRREGPAPIPRDSPTPTHAVGPTFTCPMHPEVLQDHPGKCPTCGMTLVPLAPTGDEQGHAAMPGMTHTGWEE